MTPSRRPSTGPSASGPGMCTAPRIFPGSPNARSGRRLPGGPARSCLTSRWTSSPGRCPGAGRPVTRCPRSRSSRPSIAIPPPGSPSCWSPPSARCIYVGGGLRSAEARKALLTLAEHLDIPMAHSLMAKGAVPRQPSAAAGHARFLGPGGHQRLRAQRGPGPRARHPVRRDRRQLLGSRLHLAVPAVAARSGRHRPRRDRPQLPGGDRRRGGYRPGGRRDRRGSQPASVPYLSLATGCGPPSPRHGRAAFASAREQGQGSEFPLRPQRILADLRAALPADAVLVTDVGWNKNGVAQCYELPAEGRFITPGGASTMGFGPAAAVGVQIGDPERVGGGSGRRRRHERAAAGHPDGGRAGAARDFRGDEQPRPRDHRGPAGSELRRQLRLRVPRPGRTPLQPGLRGDGDSVRRGRLPDLRVRRTCGRH